MSGTPMNMLGLLHQPLQVFRMYTSIKLKQRLTTAIRTLSAAQLAKQFPFPEVAIITILKGSQQLTEDIRMLTNIKVEPVTR